MLKNNKGVSMIALVVTVIVLLILASITTYSGMDTVKDSKYYRAISQMKIMQSCVNEWYEDYKNDGSSSWEMGVELENSGNYAQAVKAYTSASTNNLNGTDIGEITGYKYFDVDCITEDLDIEGISYDFIINIDTRTVILVEGVTYNDVTYYSLGEIDGEQYNVEYEGN